MSGLASLMQAALVDRLMAEGGVVSRRTAPETAALAVACGAGALGTACMLWTLFAWAKIQYGPINALWMTGGVIYALAIVAGLALWGIRYYKRRTIWRLYKKTTNAITDMVSKSGIESTASDHPLPSLLLALAAGYVAAEKIS